MLYSNKNTLLLITFTFKVNVINATISIHGIQKKLAQRPGNYL